MNPPAATLRQATSADATRVADLLIETRRRFMPYAPSAHPEHEVRAWVANHLVPTGGVTVAERGDTVIGAMATARVNGQSWIHQMAVDPSHVNEGLGSVLLRHALSTLPSPVRLYTFQANTGARRFYERHGFTAVTFTDGRDNEERCPDVLYECRAPTP